MDAIQLTKSADDDLELHLVIICSLPCLSKVICRNQRNCLHSSSWLPSNIDQMYPTPPVPS